MTRRNLSALVAALIIGGALVGFGVVAWLAWHETGEGALAAVVGLATIILNQAAGIVRNLFPGPEIDVIPEGAGCTCQKEVG